MRTDEAQPRMVVGCFTLFVLVGFLGMRCNAGWRDWVRTPCRIEYSFKPGEKPPSDDVLLTYTYTFGGRNYTSHRYSFPTISTTNENESPGKHTTLPKPSSGECYVDPAQPEQAVISRRLDRQAWSGGIVALVAMVILGVATMFLARGFRRSLARRSLESPRG